MMVASSHFKENQLSSLPTKNKEKKKRVASQCPRGQSQSCHQCRQSIHSLKGASELKTGQERIKCSQCTRYWCEKCLCNRYGIIKISLDVYKWACPVCSNNCNCSLCRRKSGKLATGILTPLARNAGFTSVSDFLQKGTDDVAKCLQWQSPSVTNKKRDTVTKRQSPSNRTPPIDIKTTPINIKTTPAVYKPQATPPINYITSPHQSIHHDNYTITTTNEEISEYYYNEPSLKQQQQYHLDTTPTLDTPTRCLRNRTVIVSVDTPLQSEPVAKKRRVTSKVTTTTKPHPPPNNNEVKSKRTELEKEKEKAALSLKKEMQRIKERDIAKMREEKEKQKELLRQQVLQKREEKRIKIDKIRKAKQVLKEARKQAEMTRLKQISELKQLMKQKREEERIKNELIQSSLVVRNEGQKEKAELILPLPLYSPLQVGVGVKYIPMLLFVMEFLHSFNDVLKICLPINIESFCNLLQKRKIGQIFKSLLSLIPETISNYKDISDFTAEESARKWAESSDKLPEMSCDIVERRLQLLSYLCNFLLENNCLTEIIKESLDSYDKEMKEYKQSSNEIIHKSRTSLKSLAEGGASLQEISSKREEFVKQFKDHQIKNVPVCSVRQCPLGRDRYERLYWSLKTTPTCILVEDAIKEVWSILDTPQIIDQVLAAIDHTHYDESQLYEKLQKYSSKL